MTTTTQTPDPTDDGKRKERQQDIQGNVIGFNKDHMRLLYFDFQDAVTGRACIGQLTPELANGYEVFKFNDLYKELHARGASVVPVTAVWANLWLSHGGLEKLEAPDLGNLPDDFTQGMGQRAAILGDTGVDAPDQWKEPFTGGATPDAVLVVAADTPEGRDERTTQLEAILQTNSCTIVSDPQDGSVRPGDMKGHEHFGFKDGISQPGIEGFTTSSKNPDSSIGAGEFILGYPDEDGHIAGDPASDPPPAATPYNPTPVSPPTRPLPPWAKHGSYVVLRRLRQDIAAFRQAMADQSGAVGLNSDQLGAKVVGRWPSGAPMEHVPGEPKSPDPSVQDPYPADQNALDDDKINNFDFHDDTDGTRMPFATHIRKVNPRADQLPDGDRSERHRMLRRGLPYGVEFQEGESPYGQTEPDDLDRGLLFVCYQASIARTFEFVQSRWANAPDVEHPGDGVDPIATQGTDKAFLLPPDKHLSFAAWVTTTGGGYFFSPAFTGLRLLSGLTAMS